MPDAYEARTYGDLIADRYDDWYSDTHEHLGDVSATVAFLKELAGDGPALELGIGTGRVALPLQEAGVEVHGIDASEAMVARLRGKPGGERIPVTFVDFRDFSLDDRFRLVYVPFNTLFALLTQEDQISCFRAVGRHLTDDGSFVIEAFVPDLTRYDSGQRVAAIDVGSDEVRLDVTSHDPAEQTTVTQHLVVREEGIRMYPVRIRYAYPSELDLMARLVGMRLRERWADWNRAPFAANADKHISVYEPAR
jgi:SAM-dependent methyltransferase